MSTQPVLNENDFDSPGYEYLRTYQNMRYLYHKLIVLDYKREFCSIYKCPPIHRYYFSMPNKNQSEQLFLFTCLCAWLIKDKCQMNFEIEPEEYQDIDLTISTIFEALKVLLTPEDSSPLEIGKMINFPLGRLKQGYGPEVIYTMNIFADRALEMQSQPETNDRIQIIYHDKTGSSSDQRRTNAANSITIGQPFVGGGLTTRPLGSYQIDDKSLVLGAQEGAATNDNNVSLIDMHIDQADWYQQVDRVRPALECANVNEGDQSVLCIENWQDYLEATREYQKSIDEFLNQSKSLLSVLSGRIDRHLKVINTREKFIQTNLKSQIEDFLRIWRDYSEHKKQNNRLIEKVNSKADLFESHNARLATIKTKIESRIKELDDGSKLRELETITKNLGAENDELTLRIGLLLTVYAKKHSKLISDELT